MSRFVWLMRLVYRVRRQDRGHQWTPPQPSQVCHHVVDLGGVDLGVIPLYPVAGLLEHHPDLPFHQAALKLLPGGLPIGTELYARFSGIVEELIVLNPESARANFTKASKFPEYSQPSFSSQSSSKCSFTSFRICSSVIFQSSRTSDIPGFVVGPTVVGGHGLVRLVDVFSLQGQRCPSSEAVTVYPLS